MWCCQRYFSFHIHFLILILFYTDDIQGGDQYGLTTFPDIYGSGGGNTGTLAGGTGGGAIVIEASNFTFLGSLSANGLRGTPGYLAQLDSQELDTQADAQETAAHELDAALASRSGAGGGSGGSISGVATYIGVVSSYSYDFFDFLLLFYFRV